MDRGSKKADGEKLAAPKNDLANLQIKTLPRAQGTQGIECFDS